MTLSFAFTLWFVLALMTLAAVFAVVWPLAGLRHARAGSDLAVYRDQLEEVERDRNAGLIAAPEAEAARVEVGRRLIAAADRAIAPVNSSIVRRRVVALAGLVFLPLAVLGIYLTLGSPGLPGAPLASRQGIPAQHRSIESMVAEVEAHLENNPDDGRGWEVLAPIYLRSGRFDDAVKARQNALRLLGATPARQSDLGEALTAAANGVVTSEAKTEFDRAAAADPNDDKAQFFIGLAAEQDGKLSDAALIWRKMLGRAKSDTPWRMMVEQSIARVSPGATSGPNADDIAAAEALAPEQRNAMIAGMVERLAARLKDNASDLDGWVRLVRAYMVIGEKDKARAALADARNAFRDDTEKQGRIDDVARSLGLDG